MEGNANEQQQTNLAMAKNSSIDVAIKLTTNAYIIPVKVFRFRINGESLTNGMLDKN